MLAGNVTAAMPRPRGKVLRLVPVIAVPVRDFFSLAENGISDPVARDACRVKP
jgi:hypothetical protein